MAASAPTINIPGTHKALSQGWAVAIGCIAAIILSQVPVIGAVAFGIIAIGALYQTSQLLRGK